MPFSLLYFLVPWGSETPIRSRRRPVAFVDEPPEQVAPPDVARVDEERLPPAASGGARPRAR